MPYIICKFIKVLNKDIIVIKYKRKLNSLVANKIKIESIQRPVPTVLLHAISIQTQHTSAS